MNNIKTVSIQYLPYQEEVDTSKQLKAGKFLFPGFMHEYPVFGKEIYGGKFRYQTGLEPEFYSEDKAEEIIAAKEELEKYYGKGTLDPTNEPFWRGIKVNLNKKTTHLNLNKPEDKLTYYVIKGGGIFEISPSYEQAISGDIQKRWYLIEPGEYADLNAIDSRLIDKAIAGLVSLDDDKTFDDMFLVHKFLITSDRGTTKQTPKSAIYKDLSDFIHGKIVKTDKRKTPKQFIEAMSLLSKDKKRLYVGAYVKDGLYFNYITVAQDSGLQNIETKTKYGSTHDKAIAYLSSPANQDELENLKARVEKKWSE